ncbi:MAG TPA: hypothetical protein PLT08_00775, partial [Anaerolineales bacterium]|nr:hypothetical protein [Anaerolineales bacterium]
EIKILEIFSVFIKNLNFQLSPKFRDLRHLGEMSEGQRGLSSQLSLKRPIQHGRHQHGQLPALDLLIDPEHSERERIDLRLQYNFFVPPNEKPPPDNLHGHSGGGTIFFNSSIKGSNFF